jgi:CheY-like chemotaxis protein
LIPIQFPSKRVVLCIDDDPAVLYYERTLLERSGYSVLTAASARAGLGLVNTCSIDVVLIDYEMPEMNGYEVAVEIKRARPEVAVILLSGSDVPIQALTVVDAFVPKLEASRELLPTVAALCSKARDPQQNQERLHG